MAIPLSHRAQSSLVALRRILRTTETTARSLSRATGLTPPQLMVLSTLSGADEATPTTIARAVGVSQATATALIDKLAQRGFVRRRRGETDRRQVWVSLTAEGRDAWEAAPDPLQVRFAERLDALPDWEQAMIVAALERVAALMDAAEDDAAPLLHVGPVTDAGSRDSA
jgi:DNA-binding MarR family transcriptional regulator